MEIDFSTEKFAQIDQLDYISPSLNSRSLSLNVSLSLTVLKVVLSRWHLEDECRTELYSTSGSFPIPPLL